MPRKLLFILVGFLIIYSCNKKLKTVVTKPKIVSYSSLWKELENYPERTGRSDDICFLNPNIGWAINNKGTLYKTEDGGDSWKLQFKKDS